MKDLSLRRSLSERKLAKKERKDKTRSAHFDRSMTPISIIGEKKKEELTTSSNMNEDVDYGTIGGRRNKFWKLKVTDSQQSKNLPLTEIHLGPPHKLILDNSILCSCKVLKFMMTTPFSV